MRYKRFGKTGWNVSVLTIGTWAIGGAGWGIVNRNDSINAIHAMIDNGVNHIDTAQAYNMGESECVVGEALKGLRDKVYLTTKFAVRNTTPTGGSQYVFTRKEIFRMFEEQLKRLKTDYIDLYIQHWPPIDWACPGETLDRATIEAKIAGALTAVNELAEQGRVKHIGVSNFNEEHLKIAESYANIEVFQPPYSMVNRASEDVIKVAHSHGLGVMTYGSLGGGILTGAFRTLPHFEPGDLRPIAYTHFIEPKFSQVMELLKTLDKIAENHGVSLSQVVVNWNTQKEFVDTAIVGVRSVYEAEQNCAGLDWLLSDEEIKVIDSAIAGTVGK